jgi:hypothetical protein
VEFTSKILSPWLLLFALLPIVIHMLNRLRYRTVHWAAMIFLLKANKAATRRAKLRQYLLLLFRALAILFMVGAMLRPKVGGWLGTAAGGGPSVVLVLLDRSSSMEAHPPDSQESKRSHALGILTSAAKERTGSRFVLIENVLQQPLEVGTNLDALPNLRESEATDTAADIPAMLRTALDYLAKNPDSSEIWLASDLQASNWRPDSPEWKDLVARYKGLGGDMPVRIIDLSATGTTNLSLAAKSAEFRPAKAVGAEPTAGDKGTVALSLEVRTGGVQGTFPLKITRDGATNQQDLVLNAPVQRQTLKFEIAKLPDGGGWGKAELPADDNPSDNTAYFAYRTPIPLYTAVVSDLPSARRIALAAAPDKTRADRTAEVLTPAKAGDIKWKNAALIVWQGPKPTEAVEKQLRDFVEGGGVLFALPSGADSGPLGLAWSAAENPREPFHVTSWDELDGPLARTDSGASLPLARLEAVRRQIPRLPTDAPHLDGLFADGQAFLVSQSVGKGWLFACATAPENEWGTLGEGTVLVPMVQRMLVKGGARLAPPALATAGEWQPNEGEIWVPETADGGRRDPRWNAGVYKHAGTLVALNRPAREDNPDTVEADRLQTILEGVKLSILEKAMDRKADQQHSEIWPLLIVATMLFMCLEMLLATSKALAPMRQKPKPSTGGPPVAPSGFGPPPARKSEVAV